MFKEIMVPIDGSHFSELALPLALRIALKSGARLHIVRVHAPSITSAETVVTENYDQLVRDWERDALRVALSRAVAAGVTASAELLDGPVVPALQSFIRVTAIDLVVMTTHGRSGIKRAVLGSVAEACVRRTEVPILMLRPRADEDPVTTRVDELHRILVPLDGTPESEAVLQGVVTLAELAGAELVLARAAVAPFDIAVTIEPAALTDYLVRVRAQADAYLEAVRARLPQDLRISCVTLTAERVPEAIMRLAEEQQTDLIAMATHGRSGWARIAVGSVAETVLHRSATPVLLINGATAPTSANLRSAQNEPVHSGG